ncbi:Uncharacterised protein [Porphyromonas cangingivalis]|uniref:ATP-dependent DNA helicase RecQ n=1 Tax=Porphyromonas cangingivalis TaxID=36874 RepID=A0A1T4M6Q0_PORCN|nr:ATP-dependent DNA helicase RecQ [Porphyromonas cangingivalis]VEJ02313.1 Uncharacterised protein [Porphyromonas cangingivalis]
MHLTYRDVHLDYFIGRESIVSRAVSGAPLQINSDGGLSLNGCPIIRFSRAFLKQIQVLKDKNYKLKCAKVNFVLYWYKEDENREIQIILPELHFEKVKPHE